MNRELWLEKNFAVYSQPFLFQLFCSTPVGELSQRDVSPALMKSALAAFGFTQTFFKAVPGKFSFFFLFPYPLPFSVKALSRDQQICNPDLHYPMLGL